jgi:hypothetical protein
VGWQQQAFNKRKNNIPDFEAISREDGNPHFYIHYLCHTPTKSIVDRYIELLNITSLINEELVVKIII